MGPSAFVIRRKVFLGFLILCGLAVILVVAVMPVHGEVSDDTHLFISGFNAFQKGDYHEAVDELNLLVQIYPDSPLRGLSLFFLARSHFRGGNQEGAAKVFKNLLQAFPDADLKAAIEPEIMDLAIHHQTGGNPTGIPAGPTPDESAKIVPPPDGPPAYKHIPLTPEEKGQTTDTNQTRDTSEQEKILKAKAEREQMATEAAEKYRLDRLKTQEEKNSVERAAAERAEAARMAAESAANAKAEEDRNAAKKAHESEGAAGGAMSR